MLRLTQVLALVAALVLGLAPPLAAQTYYGGALVAPPTTLNNCATWAASDNGVNALTDSGVGCANHQVTISDGSHGIMVLAPSTILLPNSPAILNGTSAQPLLFIKGVATTSADGIDFDFRRIANYTGGTFGFVNATLRTFTTVSAGTTSFEWPNLCVLDNSAALADNSQNSCGYFQAHKRNGGGTWAITAELQDHNADPVSPSVTFEHDLQVKGTDVHNARVVDDLWGKSDDGNAAVIGNGFRLNTDAHTTFVNGITTQGATISNAAFAMASGQKFCVDGLTCTYTLSQGSGVLSYTGALAITGQIITTGNVAIGTGNKLCLDGIACTATLSQSGGTITAAATAVSLPATTVASLASTGNIVTTGSVVLPATKNLCLDGISCANTIGQSGGTITVTAGGASQLNLTSTAVNLGTANALSLNSTGAVSGSSLTSTGNIILSTNQKLCLNGATCTIYLTFDGTNVIFGNSGASKLFVNASSGQGGFAGAVTSGIGVGVTCAAGSHATTGGITTTC